MPKEKEVLMNGISGVSFQEVPGGLRVRVKKSSKGSSKGSSSGKLRKRLPYNFKQISKQIMQAKTSNAARPLVTKMQAKLSWLYKKLRSGDYGDSEIAAAIIHAAEMQRIAKRKVKHLEQEEAAENGMGAGGIPSEDEEGLEVAVKKHREDAVARRGFLAAELESLVVLGEQILRGA